MDIAGRPATALEFAIRALGDSFAGAREATVKEGDCRYGELLLRNRRPLAQVAGACRGRRLDETEFGGVLDRFASRRGTELAIDGDGLCARKGGHGPVSATTKAPQTDGI